MRSSVSLLILLILLAASTAPVADGLAVPLPAPAPPPEVAAADGPVATAGAGAEAYDAVGYASWYGEELAGRPTAAGEPFDPAGISAAHRVLPLGSYAEVTHLATGRTILVRIGDRGPGDDAREIDLSRGAAALLGSEGAALVAVRVRAAGATASDRAALSAGRAASPRFDTPPTVLAALRRSLPNAAASRTAVLPRLPASPSVRPRAAPAAWETGRFAVQVATFSSRPRAQALAVRLSGRVESTSDLHRVRLGPFATRDAAQRARDAAARQGYGDAAILTNP